MRRVYVNKMLDIEPVIDLSKIIKDKNIVYCLESLGYKKISLIQYKAFKYIREGYSTIIISPTGTGKTEAALLPILWSIYEKKLEPVTAIYVTPLRALNRDIVERLEKIASCFNVVVHLRHGDTSYRQRLLIRYSPGHIVVTTPETFQYLLADAEFLKKLSNTRYIVIDEFREIVTSKRGIELLSSISILENMLGKRIIKIGLTATLSNIDRVVKLIDSWTNTKVLVSNAVRRLKIEVYSPKQVIDKDKPIEGERELINVDKDFLSRLQNIKELIKKYGHVLVFANTRDVVERIAWGLKQLLGMNIIGVHHGSLSKQYRLDVEKKFKNSIVKAIIATSSLELGIDIGTISYVIQYMSPRQVVRLIQRLGRSAHYMGGVARGCIIALNNFFDILESITIANRALRYNIEEESIPDKPLDVLAHQIVLKTLIKPGINIEELYNEFSSKNRVFKNLSYDDFLEVINYLITEKVLKVKENKVMPYYRAKKYFYRTTMIPETRSIPVIDVSTSKKIGSLSEEFVVLNLSEEDTIALGGGLWKVVSIEDDRIYVEPSGSYENVIVPKWEGENIPVEYKVAREAGAFIRLYSLYRRGLLEPDRTPLVRNSQDLFIDGNALNTIDDVIDDLLKNNIPIPNDKNIVVEVNDKDKYIVFYGFFGTKVSNTLKELLTTIIRRTLHIEPSIYATPYYIFISLYTTQFKVDRVRDIIIFLKELGRDYEKFKEYIHYIILNSNSFLWRIYFVAQRFGAIDPSSPHSRVTKSLLSILRNTVIGKEAFKETLLNDYDIENTYKILSMLWNNKIRIYLITTSTPTRLFSEVVSRVPEFSKIYLVDIASYRQRLLGKEVTAICMLCGFKWKNRVEELLEKDYVLCPRCGTRYVAIVKGDGEKEHRVVNKVLRKERLSSEERSLYKELQKKAVFVMDYGSIAALLLSARGVGFSEAVKIINKYNSSKKDLFELLYEAEKKFLKIRKYLK